MTLPAAAEKLITFGRALRAHGFLATTDQGISLLQAAKVLGPRSIRDIRQAAHAVYGPAPELKPDFDAVFDAHFLGRVTAGADNSENDDEDTETNEDSGRYDEPDIPEEVSESGEEATQIALRGSRELQDAPDDAALRRFRRQAPAALPKRLSRRKQPARKGETLDRRGMLKQAARFDGDVLTLPKRRRKQKLRPVLLLIDVSGSMKEHSDGFFRFAHELRQLHGNAEVFALGTELTRVSRALSLKNQPQALSRASALVPDWDGGTRLGDGLTAFLAVPKWASMARGALVITLSDGLERGGAETLEAAVRRLSQMAWQHLWLSPLARSHEFQPETDALIRIRPLLDGLGSAASVDLICQRLLEWRRGRHSFSHNWGHGR